MSKIVDFFPYYDPTGRQVTELRVRLYENLVDEFVICESNLTHSGFPAQQGLENLIQEANLPRNKIKPIRLMIPAVVTPLPIDRINCYGGNDENQNAINARARERMQKDSLLSVIDDYDDDTFFIISDQDEIINPQYLPWILDVVERAPDYILKIPMVHLEGRADLRVHMRSDNSPKKWDTPVCVVKKHHLKKVSPISIRGCTQNIFPTIYITIDNQRVEDMGWHFSWMGSADERVAKLEGFAHYDDKHEFLETESYSSPETKEALIKMTLADGMMPPSCNKHEVLRNYSKSKLPRMIFSLPRVCEYLLPEPTPLPYLFEEAKIDMGGQPECSARFVYDEFVLDNVYERYNEIKDDDVVVDVGANIGLLPLMLKFCRPAHVYCIEPSNGLFEVLKKNTSGLPFPITYLHYGISTQTGEKKITEDDWIYGEHGEETFKTKTFKDFLAENKITHIDFLKTDCEGGEYDIFNEENYEFLTQHVGYIAGEWHMGGMENGVEKFIKFKNLYLKGKNNFRVFEPYGYQREITKDILDDDYIKKYFDWWNPRGHAAQFQIYIDNTPRKLKINRRRRQIKCQK
jgi:beta-1,4-mannosyl-glycoprotein beta-1,4-N-acetylglucosaminyltransferase